MKKMTSKIVGFLAVVGFCWPLTPVSTAVEHSSLFRYSGDGRLPLFDARTKNFSLVTYRNTDGTYNEEELTKIDQMLACHLQGEQLPISLKLIELVDHLQDHFKAKEVEVISGYRSPEYNAELKRRNRRVARHSMHMRGRAMDLKLQGVPSALIRDYAVSLQAGGVGYYGRNRFIHIDSGPVRNWGVGKRRSKKS